MPLSEKRLVLCKQTQACLGHSVAPFPQKQVGTLTLSSLLDLVAVAPLGNERNLTFLEAKALRCKGKTKRTPGACKPNGSLFQNWRPLQRKGPNGKRLPLLSAICAIEGNPPGPTNDGFPWFLSASGFRPTFGYWRGLGFVECSYCILASGST